MRLQGIDHVALYVADVRRSAEWYREVLGLERRHAEAWGDHPIVMAAGTTSLALFPARDKGDGPIGAQAAGLFAHVAFRLTREALREGREELARRGIAFEEQDHEIARSVYFRDPDGHQLELTTYEVA